MSSRAGSSLQGHPFLAGGVIALILLMSLFLIGEISLRLFTSYPPPPFGFVKDGELGHFIQASFYKKHTTLDGETYEIRTNSLGLFDKEYKGDRPAVLLIGDSFTISAVPFEGKWGSLLEQKLGLRVVKAGVSAYGTEKEFLLLRRLSPVVKPKVIVLGHYLNDFIDDYIGIDRYTVINGHLHEMKTMDPVTGNIYRKHFAGYMEALARHNIASFGFFSDRFQYFTSKKMGIALKVEEFDPTLRPLFNPQMEWTGKIFETNFRNILRIRDYADDIGAVLVVLIIPAKEQVYEDIWQRAYSGNPTLDRSFPNRKLVQFLEQNAITYINLMTVFQREIARQETGTIPRYYYDLDIHWNWEGDRVVADEVARLLGGVGISGGQGVKGGSG